MKLNKKGFVSSAVLYSLLLLFLALVLGLLSLLSNRKQILDKLKGDIKNEINQTKIYEVYENGTAIYYNPVTGKMCGDYKEENSVTGVTEGCLKWYIFNDDKNRATVNMILDHNTSGNIPWNSENNNSEMKEVKEELDNLVLNSKWKQQARMITIDEITKITGNTSFDSTKRFFFETNTSEFPSEYKGTYSWLYDYTKDCTNYGCKVDDSSTTGYWTSSSVDGTSDGAWHVFGYGNVDIVSVSYSDTIGIRPVITISKKDMENVQTETLYDYTGSEQQFIVPKTGYYKIELWGAQGGSTSTSAIGGKGAYTSGYIYLEAKEKIYIYVGGAGGTTEAGVASSVLGGYNGGGPTGGQDCCGRKFGSGGGATDIRLVNGNWNDTTSLNSRIMVAAGGGGAFQNVQTSYNLYNDGGYGGTLVGGNGSQSEYGSTSYTYCYGEGATQTSGGKITTDCTQSASYGGAVTGNFGIGGGTTGARTGGGGGYYGGSQSGHIASAGGGSSYISGYIGAIAISSATDRNPKSGCTIGTNNIVCSKHYSNNIFMNPVMKAGNQSMPSHDSKSTMTGNSGNGYAKITYAQEVEYSYSGEAQQFIVPKTGNYKIELWGAQGGNNGGKGAYTSGIINLSKEQQIYVYVGGAGSKNSAGKAEEVPGGYNGGGLNYGQECCSRVFGSGGGATDIRLVKGTWNNFDSLKSRIMVASGGGGTFSDASTSGKGGAGGTINGVDATGDHADWCNGLGATQTKGGSISENTGKYCTTGDQVGYTDPGLVTGKFGMGGTHGTEGNNSTGGGSGYYGGSSSGHIASAGGGSSFISGHTGCDAINETSTESNIIHTGQPNHYSGLVFKETNMFAGNESMPTHDGQSTMIGNSGSGYAKITYLES